MKRKKNKNMTYVIIAIIILLLFYFVAKGGKNSKNNGIFVGYGSIDNFNPNENAKPTEAAYYNNLGGILLTKEIWDFCKEIPQIIHPTAQKWKAFETVYWGCVAALGLLYDYYFNQNLKTFSDIANRWVGVSKNKLGNYFYWYRRVSGQNENSKIEPNFANFAKAMFAILRSESGWSQDGTRFLMPDFVDVNYLESMQSDVIKYLKGSKNKRFSDAGAKAAASII